MRNCKTLAIFALAALVAVPEAADARSRFSSRSILGVATAPFRTAMRVVPGLSGTRFHQRRAAAARAYEPERAYAPEAARSAGIDRTRVEDAEPGRPQRPARAPASFNAYEDILGYALWPDDYAAGFFARGYGDVMKAVVSSSGTTASASAADDRTARRGRKHRARASDADREITSGVATTGMCGPQAEVQAGQTLDRISQTIELTEEQRTSLQALRAALTEAIARGKAACLDALPTTPGRRLRTAADALWVMHDADILFRTPLVNFYATLTDVQKAQLNGTKQPAAGTVQCGAGDNDLPIDAIEQSVRPTPEQRGGLAMLKGLSAEMAGYLAASCPQETPPDPVARLDAVGTRVSAMLYAVMLFDQGLSGFYLQLDDTQKKKFETLAR